MSQPAGTARVALFADSFHEVNGAALTCRQLEAYAARQGYDFLTVCCGERNLVNQAAMPWRVELRRGRLAIALDRDLSFDPLLFLRRHAVLAAVREFRPDIVHITSPGDVGILGAWVAHSTGAALVASWHTNVHEFGGRRLTRLLGFLPVPWKRSAQTIVERFILRLLLWFFGRARVTLAPNGELRSMIQSYSGKPCFPMTRGIDTDLFAPTRRQRTGGPFTIGFAGRLTPEKNVRFLAELERGLMAAGAPPFQFSIGGDGSEAGWLRAHLHNFTMPGILRGEALARAYADMDVFAFPSDTDTFGNVVLEALASGVPPVVTEAGGPKYLVESGVTGFVAASPGPFIECVLEIMRDPELHARMRAAARESALRRSWDRMFETEVYGAYRVCLGGGVASSQFRETYLADSLFPGERGEGGSSAARLTCLLRALRLLRALHFLMFSAFSSVSPRLRVESRVGTYQIPLKKNQIACQYALTGNGRLTVTNLPH